MRSRVNSVSVWFTMAMFTKTPCAVCGSSSICRCTVWGGAWGWSDMAVPYQDRAAPGTDSPTPAPKVESGAAEG